MDELAMTRDAFSARRAQGERPINGYCQPRQRTACFMKARGHRKHGVKKARGQVSHFP